MLKSRMLKRVAAIAIVLVAAAVPTLAKDAGIGIRAGTHGVGVEGAVSITQWFSVRGGYYYLSASENVDEGGISYDGDLRVGGLGVLADFFPLRGRFRVSAGLFSNDNEITIDATPTSPQEIGGMVYSPSQIGRLSGRIDFDDTAPYLGVGWGNVAKGGGRLAFLFDFGVLAQGSGDVRLSSSGSAVSQSDLDAEAAEIERDISDYDLWPVISVGLAIRF